MKNLLKKGNWGNQSRSHKMNLSLLEFQVLLSTVMTALNSASVAFNTFGICNGEEAPKLPTWKRKNPAEKVVLWKLNWKAGNSLQRWSSRFQPSVPSLEYAQRHSDGVESQFNPLDAIAEACCLKIGFEDDRHLQNASLRGMEERIPILTAVRPGHGRKS